VRGFGSFGVEASGRPEACPTGQVADEGGEPLFDGDDVVLAFGNAALVLGGLAELAEEIVHDELAVGAVVGGLGTGGRVFAGEGCQLAAGAEGGAKELGGGGDLTLGLGLPLTGGAVVSGGGGEGSGLTVMAADGAVVDGLGAGLGEPVFEALAFGVGEVGREVFSFQCSVFRGREIGAPALRALDDLRDAALGEAEIFGELGLSAAASAVGEQDGLIARGGGAFGAGEGAVVGCGCH
jgi:hypothetical protein